MRTGFRDIEDRIMDLLTENNVEKEKKSMKIFINAASNGKIMLLEPKWSHTILFVKKMIHSKEGILPDHQFLFYRGIPLDNDKTLATYCVEDVSFFHLVVCPAWFDPTVDDGIKMTVMLRWERIEMDVKPWYTGREIKAVVESSTGLQLDPFLLIHDGELLEDSMTMADRDISKESVIYMSLLPLRDREDSPTNPKKLSEVDEFEILIGYSDWEESFLVSKSKTVFEIKKMIENFYGLPPNQQVLFHGEKMTQLEDRKTLEFYNIKENSSVRLFSPSLKLSIKMPQVGTTNLLKARSFFTISDVKHFVSEEMGIPPSSQTLIHAGKLLNDAETLEACNIQRNSEVYAIFGLDDQSDELPLTIVMPKRDFLDIKVKQWFTISDVKATVESKTEVPICVQDLYYNQGKLKDWKTVSDYGIKNRSNITMEICSSQVKLFIHTQDDCSIVIEAKNSDTVDAVLNMVPQEEIDFINGQPCLILDDTRLMGDKMLAHYGIKTGCILCLDRLIQINVTIPNGKTMKVALNASYKIDTVKKKIEEICGIPYEVQRLSYLDDELDDNMTLGQYDAILGNLWVLRWSCGGGSWSFFWPSYKSCV
ncbi:hypothetical protein L1049_004866 [Liquidambar formosana]|uniref:Ubiquitin-like domain-containing protein n=1 Tax=Liquidambar formosana TaxID=63359 RepID=A0AAP0RTC9_LIQFO